MLDVYDRNIGNYTIYGTSGICIYIYIQLGCTPHPVRVTTRIITVFSREPVINLYLPLLLGRGVDPIYIYIIYINI